MREAIAAGVVKINLDTDAQYAFTRAIADHVLTNYDGVLRVDGGIGRKAAYDPRSWGAKAEAALAGHIAAVAEQFGSAPGTAQNGSSRTSGRVARFASARALS